MSVQHLDSKDFEEVVLKSDKPVLLDFWATWCGPCQMLTPVLEDLAKELDGKAIIAKVDVDDSPELAKKYMVMSVPALFVINKGEIVDRTVGFLEKDALIDLLGDLI